MAAKKPPQARRDAPAVPPADDHAGHTFLVVRETIESIVVAFVLAFLFRTFEAEAFVIPTGSMSPALQGRHKDVECTQCGMRFRTSASSEDPEELGRPGAFPSLYHGEVVGGMCPMCRYPMPFSGKLPEAVQGEVGHFADLDAIETDPSYPGDRILVDKYGYDFSEPQRWDVVVFKFPGDGEMNYIKRLVGLPGEMLRIYQGDVFTRPLDAQPTDPFAIQRKPADKVAAMLQLVHDTDYESTTLYNAKWPLRWAPTTPDGWKVDARPGEQTVQVTYSVDADPAAPPAWIRYRHQLPSTESWAAAIGIARTGSLAELAAREGVDVAEAEQDFARSIRPQLITDFNPYNAAVRRADLLPPSERGRGLSYTGTLEEHLGRNWVGDLAVDVDINVEEPRGALLLDLVEAGYHFRATIDLKTGGARLAIIDARTDQPLPFEAQAATPIKAAGEYQVRFANVDDQLFLWVNGKLVPFDNSTYDPDVLFAATGGRRGMIPWADMTEGGDQGDLAPVGVGAQGARLTVSRLAVLRDVYYIATNDDMPDVARLMDYDVPNFDRTIDGERAPAVGNFEELLARPEAWAWFRTRRSKEFPVKDSPSPQLFVMGDNSPESQDCRLWMLSPRGVPGGRYLDRRLLIGKAVAVFWPHSWGGVPGLPKLPGFPNFGDMRLVR
jgi:signal peptidase I